MSLTRVTTTVSSQPGRIYFAPDHSPLMAIMSADLNHYYLQQMGIQVWEKRPNRFSKAKLMVIGDTPLQGDDPFSGKTRVLLEQMLASIGLPEQDIYITNVFKGMFSENTAPTTEEFISDEHPLLQQIALINPVLLLTLGDIARETVNKNTLNLPMIASYSPEHLLQFPADKKRAWADLTRVRKLLSESL